MIKNPVTDHLPNGCRRIGTSYQAKQCVNVKQFAKNGPVVFVIGAMAHGKVMLTKCFLMFMSQMFSCAGVCGLRRTGSGY